MAKKITLTQKQLEEAMDVFVNKVGTETPEQALKRTKIETEKQVGTKPVNYVLSSDQMKESIRLTKKNILEARHNFLKNNSKTFLKSTFFKKS